MPKLKTHKGAAARFYVSGNGKLLRRKGHLSHLRRTKSAATKRQFSEKLPISPADAKRLHRLMPYA